MDYSSRKIFGCTIKCKNNPSQKNKLNFLPKVSFEVKHYSIDFVSARGYHIILVSTGSIGIAGQIELSVSDNRRRGGRICSRLLQAFRSFVECKNIFTFDVMHIFNGASVTRSAFGCLTVKRDPLDYPRKEEYWIPLRSARVIMPGTNLRFRFGSRNVSRGERAKWKRNRNNARLDRTRPSF